MPSKPDVPAAIDLWETLEWGDATEFQVFAVREVVRRSPRTGLPGSYTVLHVPSWTNVVALTEDAQVVLVEQYRHGLDIVTLEIPGGVVEPGEEPAAAVVRELLEETGYAGEPPELLGTVHPNPAIQDNACTTWLVKNARRVADPDPDPGEHLAVHTVPRDEIPELLRSGRITHSLVVAAFLWLALYESAVPPGETSC
jgi:8-oxo-dGTP pyrophosphatase MutT (NUDIX family)